MNDGKNSQTFFPSLFISYYISNFQRNYRVQKSSGGGEGGSLGFFSFSSYAFVSTPFSCREHLNLSPQGVLKLRGYRLRRYTFSFSSHFPWLETAPDGVHTDYTFPPFPLSLNGGCQQGHQDHGVLSHHVSTMLVAHGEFRKQITCTNMTT